MPWAALLLLASLAQSVVTGEQSWQLQRLSLEQALSLALGRRELRPLVGHPSPGRTVYTKFKMSF